MPFVAVTLPGSTVAGNTKAEPVTIADVRVPPGPTTAEVWTFSRISAELHLFVTSAQLIKQVVTSEDNTHFQTEAEAGNAVAGLGGQASDTENVEPATLDRPFKKLHVHHSYVQGGTVMHDKAETTTEESFFPMLATLLVQLYEPGGVLWSATFDAQFIYSPGDPQYIGRATIGSYADLVNPVKVLNGQSLQLRVRLLYSVPVASESGIQATNQPASVIDLYYDPEPVADYPKVRR